MDTSTSSNEVRAELKRLHSPDITDLSTFRPAVADNFGFLLQIMAGPTGSQGEESFDVFVCTPDWLKQRGAAGEIIIGLHYLLIFEYNYDRMKAFVEEACNKCVGRTWDEVAWQLDRFGKWEFEGYRPKPL